jgi:hypothetical protein
MFTAASQTALLDALAALVNEIARFINTCFRFRHIRTRMEGSRCHGRLFPPSADG